MKKWLKFILIVFSLGCSLVSVWLWSLWAERDYNAEGYYFDSSTSTSYHNGGLGLQVVALLLLMPIALHLLYFIFKGREKPR